MPSEDKSKPIGIEAPCKHIMQEMEEVCTNYDIPSSRVVLLGFSMGAAMAGHIAKSLPRACAGLVLLSGRAPYVSLARSDRAKKIHMLVCGLNGDHLVKIQALRDYAEKVRRAGLQVDYQEFPDAGHSIVAAEIRVIAKFLNRTIPAFSRIRTKGRPQGHANIVGQSSNRCLAA